MGWRLHVLAMVLVAGCPASVQLPPVAPAPPAVNEDLVAALIAVEEARCASAVRCVIEREAHYLLPIACRAPDDVLEEARADAMAPGASLDRAALERCLADGRADCGDIDWADWYEHCALVVALPSPCGRCREGLVCTPPSERCADWACRPPPGFHDACSASLACAAPYECRGRRCVECEVHEDCGRDRYCADGLCRSRGDIREACEWRAPCRDGLVCDGSACRTPGSRGEACRESAGCAGELVCLDRICEDPLPDGAPCTNVCARDGVICSGGRCLRLGGPGEPCGELEGRSLELDPQGTCAAPLRCADGACREAREGDRCGTSRRACGMGGLRCDTASSTCIAHAHLGRCEVSCPADAACSISGECVAIAAPGEACGAARECQAGACREGVCVRWVAPTEPCGPDRLCPLGWSCEAGACAPLPDIGAPCTGECRHGVCADGTCAWASPGAACGDAVRPCELDCQRGVCSYLQTELGGPCFDGVFGRCADGLDCAPDASHRYRCVEACPE
jgi:hypothetical protein